MAGITKEQAETRLTLYLAAEASVLAGQEVMIDGDRYTRADMAAIQKGIEIWEARVQRLNRTGLMVREVIPR